MPYTHYGNIGDIWKHLPLCAILEIERPRTYVETNSAYAVYRLEGTPRQQYGIFHLYEHLRESDRVAGSRYAELLRTTNASAELPSTYLGSPALAMSVLKDTAGHFIFFDLESEALEDVSHYAEQLGLGARVTTHLKDSISGTYRLLDDLDTCAFIHFDPYTIFDPNEEGLCYFDVFLEAARRGIAGMLWYGYFVGEERQAFRVRFQDAISADPKIDGSRIHCVEVFLDRIQPETVIANPGVMGCGVLTAHLSEASRHATTTLAQELVALYEDGVTFEGYAGRLRYAELPMGTS